MSERTTFFNFTASHDGVGVRPAQGLLSDAEIGALVQMTLDHGGLVSYRNNPDGTQSPYELNITYFDAITDPAVTATQPETAVNRFICSQAIMLAMVGVPGIYLHSLFGSRNYAAGVAETGRNRTINREKHRCSRWNGQRRMAVNGLWRCITSPEAPLKSRCGMAAGRTY
jgi:sucrose phosphorylase